MAIFVTKRFEMRAGKECTVYYFFRQRIALILCFLSLFLMGFGIVYIKTIGVFFIVIGGVFFMSLIVKIGMEYDGPNNVHSPSKTHMFFNPYTKPGLWEILRTGKGQELVVPGRIESARRYWILIIIVVAVVILGMASLLP